MDRTYSHIDLDERRKIARWRTAKLSVDVIAEKLGRHRSTIFRELKLNQLTSSDQHQLCQAVANMWREISCLKTA